MRITAVLSISLSIALTGCQPLLQHQAHQRLEQRIMEADQQFASAKEGCTKGKLTKQNAVKRADCIGEARIKAELDSGFPAMWVIERRVAADRESAIEYSKGKITRQEYGTATEQHGAAVRAFVADMAQQESQQQAMSALANGFESVGNAYSSGASAYRNAASSAAYNQPSMPPMNGQVDHSLEDSYLHKSQRSNSYNGAGAKGYDGTTYIPAGSDPNPPPDVMGR